MLAFDGQLKNLLLRAAKCLIHSELRGCIPRPFFVGCLAAGLERRNGSDEKNLQNGMEPLQLLRLLQQTSGPISYGLSAEKNVIPKLLAREANLRNLLPFHLGTDMS